MAKAGKRTNPIILLAGMSIGTNAAEIDDDFLLPCFIRYSRRRVALFVDQCSPVGDRVSRSKAPEAQMM